MRTLSISKFQELIYKNFRERGRTFPWRSTRNAYHIFISEVMLQQTQTSTVLPRYTAFLKAFPTFTALARAPLSKILTHWQGLGYNRRALYLKNAAQIVVEHNGALPKSAEELDALPGIGAYTAAALVTFVQNMPQVFIETNIRRVFIHFFFPKKLLVSDIVLMPLIKKYLDRANPREWYYALMDYGATLGKVPGKKLVNPNRRSAHYAIQSKFIGSDRQIRGKILRLLLTKGSLKSGVLPVTLAQPIDRIHRIITNLKRDGLLKIQGKVISLT